MRKHKITLFLCFLGFTLWSQTWTNVIQIGGENKEAITVMAGADDGDLYIGGIYDGPFEWDGMEVFSNGQDDLFLGCMDGSSLDWKWKITSGSTLDDAWSDLKIDQDGNLICAGVFWVEMQFGDIKLVNQVGGKSIFLTKIDPNGQVLWARSFDGTALKEMRGIDVDENGNIFLSGYFREQLLLNEITLSAVGETDAFVAKLNADGIPQWARSFGGRKDTRGIEIGVMDKGKLAFVGYYNDTTYFDAQALPAKTFDRDLFVTQLDSMGQVLWAKRAGGVFDEEPFDLAIDAEDNIWITGYVVGVLTVAEGFSTQSTNATSDLLILKYESDGSPLIAKTYGGTEPVQATSFQWIDDNIIFTGTYQGTVNLTNSLPSVTEGNAGFVFATDQSGQALWAKGLAGEGQVFSNQIYQIGNRIWLGGTFSNTLNLGDQSLNSKGGFDAFLSLLELSPTANRSISNDLSLKIFPNPVSDTLHLESTEENRITHLRLEDTEGKALYASEKWVTQIDLSHFPIGVYFLRYRVDGQGFSKVILVQR
ncbi:MAG: T9SS type A sorting domain-containing protein [Saprospiraceae bacterium]|nr:T9SS type A sorting domain-containing protein [Saprospiraceae bacterium]